MMMGNKRLYKQRFIEKYPNCCFCGGSAPTEEVDHVPGRVFFRDRQWPEGYEFPACVKCNRETRFEEKVVSFLARFNSPDENNTDISEFEKMMDEIAKHDPEFLTDIRPLSANETRRFLKEHQIDKPTGITTSDIPLVRFGDVVNSAVRKFGRKLFLALWFKHTGKIFPKEGAMRIVWMTNASKKIDDEALSKMFQTLAGVPPIIRNSRHMHDQFTYRFGITTSGDGAGFFVWFRQSFGLLCTMAVDRSLMKQGSSNLEISF